MTDVLDTFQVNLNNSAEDMALLPNVEPFHLGKLLDLGGKSTYIGGLGNSQNMPLDFNQPDVEYAKFLGDDDNSSSNDSDEGGPDMY